MSCISAGINTFYFSQNDLYDENLNLIFHSTENISNISRQMLNEKNYLVIKYRSTSNETSIGSKIGIYFVNDKKYVELPEVAGTNALMDSTCYVLKDYIVRYVGDDTCNIYDYSGKVILENTKTIMLFNDCYLHGYFQINI